MDWKEFLKPTIAKVLITVLLFTFFIPLTSCKLVKCPVEKVGTDECKSGCELNLGLFTHIKVMETSKFAKFPTVFLPIGVAFIAYYLIACAIVLGYNKFK